MTPFCAPFPCYIFPRWRRPRPHAAFPSWIYAATEQQNELTKTARSVSPLVSFCVVPPRLVLRLVPPSRFASRLVSCRLVVSLLSSRRNGTALRDVPRRLAIIVLARALPSPLRRLVLSVSSCDASERGGVAFCVSCRRRAFPHSLRSPRFIVPRGRGASRGVGHVGKMS